MLTRFCSSSCLLFPSVSVHKFLWGSRCILVVCKVYRWTTTTCLTTLYPGQPGWASITHSLHIIFCSFPQMPHADGLAPDVGVADVRNHMRQIFWQLVEGVISLEGQSLPFFIHKPVAINVNFLHLLWPIASLYNCWVKQSFQNLSPGFLWSACRS